MIIMLCDAKVAVTRCQAASWLVLIHDRLALWKGVEGTG